MTALVHRDDFRFVLGISQFEASGWGKSSHAEHMTVHMIFLGVMIGCPKEV
jgi:hypothetical protein